MCALVAGSFSIWLAVIDCLISNLEETGNTGPAPSTARMIMPPGVGGFWTRVVVGAIQLRAFSPSVATFWYGMPTWRMAVQRSRARRQVGEVSWGTSARSARCRISSARHQIAPQLWPIEASLTAVGTTILQKPHAPLGESVPLAR